jgi:hypothetical protein
MGSSAIEFEHLSRDQRLNLIEKLWESLTDVEREDMALTDDQRIDSIEGLLSSTEKGQSGIPPRLSRCRLVFPTGGDS